jgi:hypothetical protein
MAQKFTIDDFEQYLFEDAQLSQDEVKNVVTQNRDLIDSMLEQGFAPSRIAADIEFK